MKPRSRIMYSWNQNGADAALATSWRSHTDTVESVKGMPAFSAARTAWTSPRLTFMPAKPMGPSANGDASRWPNSSTVVSRSSTSRSTL